MQDTRRKLDPLGTWLKIVYTTDGVNERTRWIKELTITTIVASNTYPNCTKMEAAGTTYDVKRVEAVTDDINAVLANMFEDVGTQEL